MRTGQEHRGWTVWGKLLLYDARRWVSEQWVTRHTGARGRTGLRPRHQRTLAKLAKVGRAEIREVKIDIRSGYCNNCANWNKLRSEGYEDGNKTIRLLSAGDSSESVTQQLLRATCSQSCMFCFLAFFKTVMFITLSCVIKKTTLLAVKASFHFPWQDMLMKAAISKCPVRYSNLIKCLMLHLYRSE